LLSSFSQVLYTIVGSVVVGMIHNIRKNTVVIQINHAMECDSFPINIYAEVSA